MIQQSNISEIKETLDVEAKAIQTNDSHVKFVRNKKGRVRIVRNLLTDTFDVYIDDDIEYRYTRAERTPFLNINNKEMIGYGDDIWLSEKAQNGGETYKVFHSMIHDMKFSDLTEMYVGVKQGNDIMYSYALKFTHHVMPNSKTVNENNALSISSISEVTIDIGSNVTLTGNWGASKSIIPIIDVKHSKLFYVPTTIDRTRHIESLASIYVLDDKYSRGKQFLPEHAIAIKTSGTAGTLEGYVDTTEKSKILRIENSKENGSPIFYGDVKISTNTYYDYSKGKTVVGFSSDSKSGDLVPYNYKGSYSWIQQIQLFPYIGKFRLSTSHLYKQPVLEPFEGMVVLNINNNSIENLNPAYRFKLEDLSTLQEDKIFTVEALKRISIEPQN